MAHYTPVPETDKQITRNEIYLIDAGTQYKGECIFYFSSSISFFILIKCDYTWLDGTTDITRTIHFGNATEREKDAFTRVLKGFIAVATAIFPPNAPVKFIIFEDIKKIYNSNTYDGVRRDGFYLGLFLEI